MLGISCLRISFLVAVETRYEGNLYVFALMFPFRDLWKDMNKPEEVVPIMELCAHSHSLNSRGNPIIVHCSAGVGRTGTFIALDHLMHDTLDFKNITERSRHSDRATEECTRDLIEQIVLQLPSQRMKMVQTKDQFLFIYHAAKYLNSLSVNQ